MLTAASWRNLLQDLHLERIYAGALLRVAVDLGCWTAEHQETRLWRWVNGQVDWSGSLPMLSFRVSLRGEQGVQREQLLDPNTPDVDIETLRGFLAHLPEAYPDPAEGRLLIEVSRALRGVVVRRAWDVVVDDERRRAHVLSYRDMQSERRWHRRANRELQQANLEMVTASTAPAYAAARLLEVQAGLVESTVPVRSPHERLGQLAEALGQRARGWMDEPTGEPDVQPGGEAPAPTIDVPLPPEPEPGCGPAQLEQSLSPPERVVQEARALEALWTEAQGVNARDGIRLAHRELDVVTKDGDACQAALGLLGAHETLWRALPHASPLSDQRVLRAAMARTEVAIGQLGGRVVGAVGEAFDPDLHQAVTSGETAEKVVTETGGFGLVLDGRLVKPALVGVS